MEPSLIVAITLCAAVALGWARLIYRYVRRPKGSRSGAVRLGLLLLAQPVVAGLLFLTLWPPVLPAPTGTLIVATRHAALTGAGDNGERLILLPEAPNLTGGERVPDLATALRKYPQTRGLRVVGDGLTSRDLEAAATLPLSFDPRPLPRGLVRLYPPESVAPGAVFAIGGQVNDVAGGVVELIDPADRRIDSAPITKEGGFTLTGTARTAGPAKFTVRVRDVGRNIVQAVPVPVVALDTPAPRLLILGGAPGPELKYLRRWATDSGMTVHSQMSAGAGLQLGDPPVAMTAATLKDFDLVVLDERSWADLSDGGRASLIEAVRGGLGVAFRVTGPLSEATRAQWRAMGFSLSADTGVDEIALTEAARDEAAVQARRGSGTRDAPTTINSGAETPVLTRRRVRVDAADSVPLWPTKAEPLALWRAEGRGRVAVVTVTDTYSLVLTGQGDRFGELWAEALTVLARPVGSAAVRVAPEARVHQRLSLCGLEGAAQVVDADGRATRLLTDATTGPAGCAAYWPGQAGWHSLNTTDAARHTTTTPFYVYEGAELSGLTAVRARDDTLALVSSAPPATSLTTGPGRRGESWPWALAWLSVSAALWGFERNRLGRPKTIPT